MNDCLYLAEITVNNPDSLLMVGVFNDWALNFLQG
jgi:hypothetical protein